MFLEHRKLQLSSTHSSGPEVQVHGSFPEVGVNATGKPPREAVFTASCITTTVGEQVIKVLSIGSADTCRLVAGSCTCFGARTVEQRP